MAYRLPPLAAIRVFEAAARHASFTKAAAELGMTQAAVSYQIKLLEERVGSPLFLRLPRQVALTAVGEKLAPAVTRAFEAMDDAFAATRLDGDDRLHISVVATFASHWLVERLGRFQLEHPAISLRLSTSQHLIDFNREEIDLGIRSGIGEWPGLTAHLLLKADFTPMLSPALAASIGGVHQPGDLLKLPLVDAGDPWWVAWFEANGVAYAPSGPYRGNRLGSQHLEALAATAGQGVAILTPAFFGSEITRGNLIRPFEVTGYDGHGYWLVYPEGRRNLPKIRAFREWILAEIDRERTKKV